jgi:putative hydrolase of the HAD superfamily
MPGIKLVIFDLDGVLCHTDFARRLEYLGEATGLEPGVIDRATFQSGFEELADRGNYSAAEYLRLFGEHLGVAICRQDWLDARRRAMTPNHGMLALARRLQSRLSVAMLTNNGPLLRECFGEVFPEAAELFGDRAFFSYQFSSSKEEPEIFQAILKTLGGRPETTLFIDDSEAYIASAQCAGLATHHYSGFDDLMAALGLLGLSPAAL